VTAPRASLDLRFGLLYLLRVEVQLILGVQDRLPGEILSGCFIQVLQAGLVRREKDERVAVRGEACCREISRIFLAAVSAALSESLL